MKRDGAPVGTDCTVEVQMCAAPVFIQPPGGGSGSALRLYARAHAQKKSITSVHWIFKSVQLNSSESF